MFVYDLLKAEGQYWFQKGEPTKANHKYEEALSLWIYYVSNNPNWEKDGVDDEEIQLIDDWGRSEFEKEKIKDFKLNMYSNIAVCSLKIKEFSNAILACEEALKLDN